LQSFSLPSLFDHAGSYHGLVSPNRSHTPRFFKPILTTKRGTPT
jgi:hypothetical protein